MNYVDVGYAVGLSVLFLYAIGLVLRRRALEHTVEFSTNPEPSDPPSEPTTGEP